MERKGIESASSFPGVNAWATQNVGMTGWEFRLAVVPSFRLVVVPSFRPAVIPSFRPERSGEPEPRRGSGPGMGADAVAMRSDVDSRVRGNDGVWTRE